jgi:hypothetical protein
MRVWFGDSWCHDANVEQFDNGLRGACHHGGCTINLARPYTDFPRSLVALPRKCVSFMAKAGLSNPVCARYVTEPDIGSELNSLRLPVCCQTNKPRGL